MPRRPRPTGEAVHRDQADPAATLPSKTQLKAQARELKELGLDLSKLPADRLAATQMPDALREAIRDYQNTNAHGARRRQLQYIGKILRGIDVEPLRAAVQAFAHGLASDKQALHRAERWRDALIADDEAMTRWMSEHPGCDVQHLRSLVRSARRDAAADPGQRQHTAYRELFRFIRAFLTNPD